MITILSCIYLFFPKDMSFNALLCELVWTLYILWCNRQQWWQWWVIVLVNWESPQDINMHYHLSSSSSIILLSASHLNFSPLPTTLSNSSLIWKSSIASRFSCHLSIHPPRGHHLILMSFSFFLHLPGLCTSTTKQSIKYVILTIIFNPNHA